MSTVIAKPQKVVVIGAGFSGLVASYYLLRGGFTVEIYEAEDRPGGLIHTSKTEFGLVETAANGLLNCSELENLCHEIGVELIATKPDARNRFVFRNNRARRWPLKVFESIKLIGFLFRYVIFKNSVAPRAGETLSQWGERVLGVTTSRYSIETAVLGIYGADARTLSASLILKRLFSSKSERESLRLGNGTVSPKGGMGELIEGLTAYLQVNGVRINYGYEVTDIENTVGADYVVIATSAYRAAELLRCFGDERSEIVEQISMLPVTSTTLFTQAPHPPKIKGFGVLFPEVDNHSALGVLFNNYIFENRAEDCQSDTWITSGAEIRDQSLLDSILSEREKVLHQKVEVIDYKINRWPKALPHYNLELEEVLKRLVEVKGRIALIGNYLGEIGLKQILLRAKRLSEELARGST